jgi:hypothetical protein
MLLILIGWFILSFVIAGAAYERGRSAFGWFLFSIVFSPLIAGLFLLLFPPLSSVDDQTLQGTIRATDQLSIAVQELRGAIREGRTEPQRSPSLSYSAVEQPSSSHPASEETALERQMTEPPRKRGVGSWILLIAVLGTGLALTAFGISELHELEKASVEAVPTIVHGTSVPIQSDAKIQSASSATDPKKLDYGTIAALPCTAFLDDYGTTQPSSLIEPLIATIGARGDGLGSGANIIDFVATECRLHEKVTIGQAIENLFDQQRHNRLPRIPIGGATSDPEVHASWEAFDKWIHHRGPRPDFGVTSLLKSNIAQEKPIYLLDASQTNVLALSNLDHETEFCQPARIYGTIVQRQFDDKLGTVVTGVTVKEANGQKTVANVDVNLDRMDMVTKGWVTRGLQLLLQEGNRVELGVKLCGAAGRVVMLDAIAAAESDGAQTSAGAPSNPVNAQMERVDRYFWLAFNASICQLRSNAWFGVIRTSWDTWHDEVIRETGITYDQANKLSNRVRGQVEAEFGQFPSICQRLRTSAIMDDLDAMEARATGNYH